MPRPVVTRARELLATFEMGSADSEHSLANQKFGKKLPGEPAEQQLDFFGASTTLPEPSPVLEALRLLNINELTPIEALNKLYELQQQVGD